MDLCQRLGRPGKSLAWPEAVSKRPATYSLTTVATLASRANGARGTRSTRGAGGSSRASLTTVTLARKRKEVHLAPTERARLGQGSSRWGCGQDVQPSYLGARRTISSRGAFSTGRSLQRERQRCVSQGREAQAKAQMTKLRALEWGWRLLTSRPDSPGGPANPGGPMGPGGPRSPLDPEGPCLPGSP